MGTFYKRCPQPLTHLQGPKSSAPLAWPWPLLRIEVLDRLTPLVKTREARLDCISRDWASSERKNKTKRKTKQPSKNSLQARRPSWFFCFISSLCYILKDVLRISAPQGRNNLKSAAKCSQRFLFPRDCSRRTSSSAKIPD